MPKYMGKRSGAKNKSPKADAAMEILAGGLPSPPMGGAGPMPPIADEIVMDAPEPGGGDVIVELQGLLDGWDDKEHPYYKDVEALVLGASA
tara:strand:- start:1583 stop:1855 length:273 start_codon:yes stop_codon:yes gene_type:complete